ncbi:MAG: hypothetical protein R3B09_32310 [Nannocystaceae bacterium]
MPESVTPRRQGWYIRDNNERRERVLKIQAAHKRIVQRKARHILPDVDLEVARPPVTTPQPAASTGLGAATGDPILDAPAPTRRRR